VVISSRKADACDAVAAAINKELAGATGKAVAIPAHVGERDQLERLVAETRRQLGPIDILVCNAAVNPYHGPSKDIPDSAFDKIMNVNIRSNHWLAHLVLPEMVERKSGSIIVTCRRWAACAAAPGSRVRVLKAATCWSATWPAVQPIQHPRQRDLRPRPPTSHHGKTTNLNSSRRTIHYAHPAGEECRPRYSSPRAGAFTTRSKLRHRQRRHYFWRLGSGPRRWVNAASDRSSHPWALFAAPLSRESSATFTHLRLITRYRWSCVMRERALKRAFISVFERGFDGGDR
jgi:NAD(P)-dependent dehydrogenase (short-subunit alcohol dehydrogenase family)